MKQVSKQSNRRMKTKRIAVALAMLTVGTAYISLPSCEGVLTTFNPCGTVLDFCQPYEIDALFGDPVGDWDLDPTCSVPYWGVRTGDATLNCGTTVFYP